MAAKKSKQAKDQGGARQVAGDPLEITVQEEGPIKRILTIQVPPTRVKSAFDRAYQSLRGRAKVAGFRKGNVPRKILEHNYGDQVSADVVESLIESCCVEALREKEIAGVANPQLLGHDFADGDALTFQVQVEVRPHVDLKTYKGLEVERRIVRVDESHIDDALRSLRERYATLVTEEDRINVATGDVVVFDMEAFSRGERLENASAEGVQMEVGAGRFPDELENGIVGVTRSIPTSIDVHFPEDHRDSELAGKLVRFQVTVREIKNKILPPLNDDLASEVNLEDCDTLADLRKKIREDLEARSGAEADRRARNDLLSQLVDAH
ncbi:MAG: trigger factor, partial [Myxococcales bacterium]